jgi:hypothetical protein
MDDRIIETASVILATLEAKIAGNPTITLHDRAMAIRLLSIALNATIEGTRKAVCQ